MKKGEYYIYDRFGEVDVIRIDNVEYNRIHYTYIIDSIRNHRSSYWRHHSYEFLGWRKLDDDEIMELLVDVL